MADGVTRRPVGICLPPDVVATTGGAPAISLTGGSIFLAADPLAAVACEAAPDSVAATGSAPGISLPGEGSVSQAWWNPYRHALYRKGLVRASPGVKAQVVRFLLLRCSYRVSAYGDWPLLAAPRWNNG